MIDSSSSSPNLSVEASYRGVGNYHNNKMFLTKSALYELWTNLSFTQLRFHCSKQQGRTFHVITVANSTGEAVVQYFSGQTDINPDACGSFFGMKNDNSRLAGACDRWKKGKWGGSRNGSRLFCSAAFIPKKHYWCLKSNKFNLECDDSHSGVSPGDFWKVYVR